MTISSSSNNNNIYDDDNNIMLLGSKSSSDNKTTLKLPPPVVNESSDAGYGHIDLFPQALREAHMTFEDYENMECVPIDYEAETVACRLYYEKTLKELYERKDWPTGPNKANKQLSFVPPFLSKGLVSHIKLKVNRGKCKKKKCILSNRRQKNKVLRSTKLRKPNIKSATYYVYRKETVSRNGRTIDGVVLSLQAVMESGSLNGGWRFP